MSMEENDKVKKSWLPQTLLWNLYDAPEAQAGRIAAFDSACPSGTSQTPQIGGLRQPSIFEGTIRECL